VDQRRVYDLRTVPDLHNNNQQPTTSNNNVILTTNQPKGNLRR
jgi:hypothetical protein